MPYKKCVGVPTMIFSMQLDSPRTDAPELNRGRLALIDDTGEVGHWVFTSSLNGRQSVGNWNIRGGVIPPTSSMPGSRYWEFHTKRLYQPGQFVDDGFLITFRGSTEYTTKEGAVRSEIMIHNDKNRSTSPGTLGCIGAITTAEWDDFCDAIVQSVAHLPVVRLFVIYSY